MLSSVTLTAWGSVSNGVLYERQNVALHISVSVSSSLLPTPRVSDSNGPIKHGDGGLDLRTTVSLLPTPAVNDMGRGKTIEWWDDWTATMRAKHNNGNGHGKSLEIEAQRLLPTPTVQQGRNATSGRQPDAVFNTGTTLNDWAWEISDYLPTPAARDHKDSLDTRHAVTGKADYLPRAIGEMITDANL